MIGAGAEAPPVAIEVAASPRPDRQHFAVHALAPGSCELQAAPTSAAPKAGRLTFRVIVELQLP